MALAAVLGSSFLLSLVLGAPPGGHDPDPRLEEALRIADAHRWAERREWLLLLHYEASWLGVRRSTVDSPDFFLSPEGKTNPRAELRATLEAFFRPESSDAATPEGEETEPEGPACRFRARFHWLEDILSAEGVHLDSPPCPRFEAWARTLAAASVRVVFASAYLNNPASMFGHTMLLLDRGMQGRTSDLVAYAVSFAAEPTTSNPLFYAVLGLTGGFAGRFSTVPFYLKVKEYGDFENRDLYEYALALETDEVAQLVRHLWEIGPSRLDYYYFDENCAYQLLRVLEAAAPRLHLSDDFHGFVIPSDTVRALLEVKGLVRERGFRASRHTMLLARRRGLSSAERSLVLALALAGPEVDTDLGSLAPERRRAVLDAASELVAYRAPNDRDPERVRIGQKLLQARNRLRMGPREPSPVPALPPEGGHGTSLFAAGMGWSRSGVRGDRGLSHLAIAARPALHDLLAAQAGYAETSEIALLDAEFRIPLERGSLALERLDLARIVALSPLDTWAPRPSWRVRGGLSRVVDFATGARPLAFGLSGGPGLAFRLARAFDCVGYGFVDAELATSSAFRHRFRARVGASLGLLVEPLPGYRLQLSASQGYALFGEERGALRAPWSTHRAASGLSLSVAQAISLAPALELRFPMSIASGRVDASLLVQLYF